MYGRGKFTKNNINKYKGCFMKPIKGENAMLDFEHHGYTQVHVLDILNLNPQFFGIDCLVYLRNEVNGNQFFITENEFNERKRFDYDGYSTR